MRTFIILVIFYLFRPLAYSQTLEFSEVRFKEQQGDQVTIKINQAPKNDFNFRVDKTNIPINKVDLANINFIQIFFKSPKEFQQIKEKTLEIYTKNNGLTATNEQLILESNNGIEDVVCWQNNSPTNDELEELKTILKKFSIICVNSEEVKTNQAIIKENNNWIIQTENPKTNGDLSDKIFISEIFPNPKGQDSQKEWIELYNASNKIVRLGNWQIKTESANNLTNEQIIPPNSFLQITTKLPNNNGAITLLDYQNKIIDQIYYSKTQEDKSLTKILIANKQKIAWLWTNPTPSSPNPQLQEISGKIIEEPSISKNYSFTISPNTKIIISENLNFYQEILKKNTEVKILAHRKNNQFYLQDLKIIKPPTAPQKKTNVKSSEIAKFSYIPLTLAFLYLTWRYKSAEKHQHDSSHNLVKKSSSLKTISFSEQSQHMENTNQKSPHRYMKTPQQIQAQNIQKHSRPSSQPEP